MHHLFDSGGYWLGIGIVCGGLKCAREFAAQDLGNAGNFEDPINVALWSCFAVRCCFFDFHMAALAEICTVVDLSPDAEEVSDSDIRHAPKHDPYDPRVGGCCGDHDAYDESAGCDDDHDYDDNALWLPTRPTATRSRTTAAQRVGPEVVAQLRFWARRRPRPGEVGTGRGGFLVARLA